MAAVVVCAQPAHPLHTIHAGDGHNHRQGATSSTSRVRMVAWAEASEEKRVKNDVEVICTGGLQPTLCPPCVQWCFWQALSQYCVRLQPHPRRLSVRPAVEERPQLLHHCPHNDMALAR